MDSRKQTQQERSDGIKDTNESRRKHELGNLAHRRELRFGRYSVFSKYSMNPLIQRFVQEHSRTRKTGPYGRKELRLVIMAMEDAETTHAILGALTICLNEFNGLMNHEVKLPIECDAEIVNAVGAPHFYFNIRSWYKKTSGGTSISSGVTSTGWTNTEHSESDGEDLMLTHPDDPVKALEESMNTSPKITDDSINSLVGFSIESVPENAEIEQSKDTSPRFESVRSPVEGLVENRGDSEKELDSEAASETTQNHSEKQYVEILKNEEQDDRISDPDDSKECNLEISESSFKNTESLDVPVRNLFKRLSTIKSEGDNEEKEEEEEAELLPDQREQSLVQEIDEVLEDKVLAFETTNEAIDQITELQNQTNEDLDKKQDFDKNTENQNLGENEGSDEKTENQYFDKNTENQDLVKDEGSDEKTGDQYFDKKTENQGLVKNEDPVEKTGNQYFDKDTEDQDLVKNESSDEKTVKQYSDKNTEDQNLVKSEDFEERPQEQVVEKPEDDSEEKEKELIAVSLTLDSLNDKDSTTLETALLEHKETSKAATNEVVEAPENDKTETKSINLVSYPVPSTEQATTTTEDENKVETSVKSEIEAEEEKEVIPRKVEVVNQRTPVEIPVWMRWLNCVPGGRLLCCQPALPREP